MVIGEVSALVILTMVDLNFVRTAPWEAMFLHNLAHAVFVLSKISHSTKPMVIMHLSTTAAFQLWPTVLVSSRPKVPNYEIGRDRGEE